MDSFKKEASHEHDTCEKLLFPAVCAALCLLSRKVDSLTAVDISPEPARLIETLSTDRMYQVTGQRVF